MKKFLTQFVALGLGLGGAFPVSADYLPARSETARGHALRMNTIETWACDDAKRDARSQARCSLNEDLYESYMGSCFCHSIGGPFGPALPGGHGDWDCSVDLRYECREHPSYHPKPTKPPVPIPLPPNRPPPLVEEPPPRGGDLCDRIGGCPDPTGSPFAAIEGAFRAQPAPVLANGAFRVVGLGTCVSRRDPRRTESAALVLSRSEQGSPYLTLLEESPPDKFPTAVELPRLNPSVRQTLLNTLIKRFQFSLEIGKLTVALPRNGALVSREWGEFEHRLRGETFGDLFTESYWIPDLDRNPRPGTAKSYSVCRFPRAMRL